MYLYNIINGNSACFHLIDEDSVTPFKGASRILDFTFWKSVPDSNYFCFKTKVIFLLFVIFVNPKIKMKTMRLIWVFESLQFQTFSLNYIIRCNLIIRHGFVCVWHRTEKKNSSQTIEHTHTHIEPIQCCWP